MKKLLIIPVIVFLVTIGIIAFNFIANSTGTQKKQDKSTVEKEEQSYDGNKDFKTLDDTSVILQPLSTTDPVQRSKQILLIRKNALDSGTIFISENCSLSPLVTHITAGESLSFYNESVGNQTLKLDNKNYNLKPENKIQLQNLPTVETQLPITCGNPEIIKGYIYITPARPTDRPQELDNSEEL